MWKQAHGEELELSPHEPEPMADASRTAAYTQLLAICQSGASGDLTREQVGELLDELDVYLDREILRFHGFPDQEIDDYLSGLDQVVLGLEQMKSASSVARLFLDEGEAGHLQSALMEALVAEESIRAGTQLLQRASDSLREEPQPEA